MKRDQSDKRGRVTDEHKAEAAALREIWTRTLNARREHGVATQEAFGAQFNIGNQSAVGFFLNGKTALSMKAALAFAKGLGCQVAEFSPRLAALLPPASGTHYLDEPERDLLETFRSMNTEQRAQLLGFAKGITAGSHRASVPSRPARKQKTA